VAPLDLPPPDSDELRALVSSASARVVYRVLYEHPDHGVTLLELRELAAPYLAEEGLAGEQEQLDRRKRDLHPIFTFEQVRDGNVVRHRLTGRKAKQTEARTGISAKTRAIVLQPNRCGMCGRTPLEDGVKLVVDHRIPLAWGGSSELENLWPLCEECNAGKKDHFKSFDADASAIRQAMGNEEPHRRIGELLKALEGQDVRSDLIGVVASAGRYQEDWQKRLRELRTLGWTILTSRRFEEGRSWSYYRLEHWEPWPEGKIRTEITRRERERRGKRPS